MTGEEIPDKDNVARYCSPMRIDNGIIQASAFYPGNGEDNLSVNWLEILGCSSRDNEIAQLQQIYRSKFNRVAKGGKITVLNVGDIRKKVFNESEDKRILRIIHDPSDNDESHSIICNMMPKSELIAELILQVVNSVYPARKDE